MKKRYFRKKFAELRKEQFGGMLLSDDPWKNITFVPNDLIDLIEQENISDDLFQYLVNIDYLEGKKSSTHANMYALEELTIDEDFDHLSAPIIPAIELTYGCNLRCPHCGPNSLTRQEDEMTTKEVISLIQRWKELKVFGLILSGGEPFFRPDIFDILNYCDEIGLYTCVLTNGLLINKDTLPKIPGNIQLQISIDGVGEVYERIRGHGTFKRLESALDLLESDDRVFAATMVYNHANADSAIATLNYCIKRGIRLKIDPLFPLGRVNENMELLCLTEADADKFLDLREEKIRYGHERANDLYPGGRSLNLFDLPEVFGALFLACEGGRFDAWVRPNGDVYPCANVAAIEQFNAGNIREKDFFDIWENSLQLKEFRKLNWAAFENCHQCEIFEYCNFRCPMQSYVKNGAFNGCGADNFTKAVISKAIEKRITSKVTGDGDITGTLIEDPISYFLKPE